MAIYRNVSMKFWTDTDIVDDFTPEDKYFYLYLLTNPHTNLCGCYEVSLKQISNETGYNKDTIERLLDRFESSHGVIKYSKETREILLVNWSRYNWTSSEKLDKPLLEQIESVKNVDFKAFLIDLYNLRDTVSIPYAYGSDTRARYCSTDTVTVSVSIPSIISYLNNKCSTNYKSNTKNTVKHISARAKEGFSEEDFFTVIDTMFKEWGSDEKMKVYLRPDTLFGTKFESYLNRAPKKKEPEIQKPQPEEPEEELVGDDWWK